MIYTYHPFNFLMFLCSRHFREEELKIGERVKVKFIGVFMWVPTSLFSLAHFLLPPEIGHCCPSLRCDHFLHLFLLICFLSSDCLPLSVHICKFFLYPRSGGRPISHQRLLSYHTAFLFIWSPWPWGLSADGSVTDAYQTLWLFCTCAWLCLLI